MYREAIKINYKEKDGGYSHVSYFPNAISHENHKTIENWLRDISYWEEGETPHGKVPRQQLWFHKELKPFTRVWPNQYPRWQAYEYTTEALKAHEIVSNCFSKTNLYEKKNFNSMLVNKYQTGEDTIAPHRDCIPEFGENPVVACVSIGSPRCITFQRLFHDPDHPSSMRRDKSSPPLNIMLEPRSLLVMAGCTQKYYCHGIDRDKSIRKCRYSLTLREHH
jgi:alkylated DNA repair dioxygenase AlkB